VAEQDYLTMMSEIVRVLTREVLNAALASLNCPTLDS
jgi:hypothetical protein